MEAILKRLDALEKEIALLKSNSKGLDIEVEVSSFKVAISNITITDKDLSLVYNSSMKKQIIRIISEFNKKYPFLKWRRVLYKYEEAWVTLEDEDIIYMIEEVEKLLIALYTQKSKELNPEKYFETAEIVYSLNLNKNFKKIKSELLQSI